MIVFHKKINIKSFEEFKLRKYDLRYCKFGEKTFQNCDLSSTIISFRYNEINNRLEDISNLFLVFPPLNGLIFGNKVNNYIIEVNLLSKFKV